MNTLFSSDALCHLARYLSGVEYQMLCCPKRGVPALQIKPSVSSLLEEYITEIEYAHLTYAEYRAYHSQLVIKTRSMWDYCVAQNIPVDTLLIQAAKHAEFELFRRLFESHYNHLQCKFPGMLLDVVYYAHRPMIFARYLMVQKIWQLTELYTACIGANNMSLLKRRRFNRKSGCDISWSTYACRYAAIRGRTRILKWLRNPCTNE